MRVLSADQCREIDRRSTEEFGVSTLLLMENAGRAVARIAHGYLANLLEDDSSTTSPAYLWMDNLATGSPVDLRPAAAARIAIVCGPGNNGGDGFAAARHLANWGFELDVFLSGDAEKISGDAAVNHSAVLKRGIAVHPAEGEGFRAALKDADLIIDALLGTGLRGEVMDRAAAVIEEITSAGTPVIAVDIPSGLHSDTGEALGCAVAADITVTFGAAKPGHLLHPGSRHTGRLLVADIGIPTPLLQVNEARGRYIITPYLVRKLLPVRSDDSHKGTFGHTGIVAGSVEYSGAACLAALGARSMGSGLTTAAVPDGAWQVVASRLLDCMAVPAGKGNIFMKEDAKNVLEMAERWDSAAIGCGLGQSQGVKEFIAELMARLEISYVLDADALNALGDDAERVLRSNCDKGVITPHPGEMARLLGTTVDWVQSNRLEAVGRAADDFGVVCVLKGAHTLVAEPYGRTFFNLTGNSGLAKGGSGDILAGMIAGLLAQGLSPIDAAVAGVWMHGQSADIAAERVARAAMTAEDVLDCLSDVFTLLDRA